MKSALQAGIETLEAEAEGLRALVEALQDGMAAGFVAALALVRDAPGRLIVTGMGKSGHIARKIASTFASTGQPAQFVHPSEASHGDLGMITAADCVLALSRSGETPELSDLVVHCRRQRTPLIAMTFVQTSALARAADVALILPARAEASLDAPAPTVSTTMCLALGDALAMALLRERGFGPAEFGAVHPGGKLGALLKRVGEVMRVGEDMPLVPPDAALKDTLLIMSAKRLGCAGVVQDGRLIGMITDGDLRRRLSAEAFARDARALMSPNPKTLPPEALLADAVALMQAAKITCLFVVDAAGAPLGAVHLHDLLNFGAR
jgi:arabinose-5-phosphate isomerase